MVFLYILFYRSASPLPPISFSKTIMQLPVPSPTVGLIYVTFSFFSLFCSDKRKSVMSYFNDWLFCFVICRVRLLFRLALVDMVNFTIIRLALLRYSNVSLIKEENLFAMKLIYTFWIIYVDKAGRECGSCLLVSNSKLSTNYISFESNFTFGIFQVPFD